MSPFPQDLASFFATGCNHVISLPYISTHGGFVNLNLVERAAPTVCGNISTAYSLYIVLPALFLFRHRTRSVFRTLIQIMSDPLSFFLRAAHLLVNCEGHSTCIIRFCPACSFVNGIYITMNGVHIPLAYHSSIMHSLSGIHSRGSLRLSRASTPPNPLRDDRSLRYEVFLGLHQGYAPSLSSLRLDSVCLEKKRPRRSAS